MPSLYECKVPNSDDWQDCYTLACGRDRRINQRLDPLLRLEQYKTKLTAGHKLNQMEQDDINAIAESVAKTIEMFSKALKEALAPAIEAIYKAVKSLWDSLPPELQATLLKETDEAPQPLRHVDIMQAQFMTSDPIGNVPLVVPPTQDRMFN